MHFIQGLRSKSAEVYPEGISSDSIGRNESAPIIPASWAKMKVLRIFQSEDLGYGLIWDRFISL